jgi:DNA-directed RNA polymerase II subunit RPB2
MSKESKDKLISKSNTISWNIINTMFKKNPTMLVDHHLESYNDFFDYGIFQILKENNPIKISKNYNSKRDDFDYICNFYIGGKDGTKLYYGKPIIFDDNNQHYMYPNEARLRNMTYGLTIHYDCVVDIEIYDPTSREMKKQTFTLEKILLGKFPIMVNSKLCIYNGLNRDLKFYMGECRNDNGGYFIIDGKEKVLVPQEKFSDNMLYIKKNVKDDLYSYSAIIRTVSEDSSKPIRTLKVHMVASTDDKSFGNIVVELPNVRKPIPFIIVMRALGIISDKDIMRYCLLDLNKNESYLDLLIPSVHDTGLIFTQQNALEYISSFMKQETTYHAVEILMNYFLPNIGELNFISKAYYLGHMVFSLLKVQTGLEQPTDRDSFTYKRVELSGSLIYELFSEYYIKQKKDIFLKIDKDIYYHHTVKDGDSEKVVLDHDGTIKMINNNYKDYFKSRLVESGFKKGFKGNWGASTHTKRLGIIQDLNRLSYNSYISQLRKINLPLDSSAKVVGPRLLHSTQWGIIDPIDTPDGGNIGLHKHMAIGASISTGYSGEKMLNWMKQHVNLYTLEESYPEYIYQNTKVFINGSWVGYVLEPFVAVNEIKVYRRLGLIPNYTSVSFHIQKKTIFIFTDSGRISRPLYYITSDNVPSVFTTDNIKRLTENKLSWSDILYGFNNRLIDKLDTRKIYDVDDLYDLSKKSLESIVMDTGVVDYVDTSESESALIAVDYKKILAKEKRYTHLEIHASLIFGVMGNQIIYPENNPPTRNLFSCGQTKQAVSMYHTNYQNRIDKAGIVLNCGQVPLVKSRYMKYINNEELPYGVNTIVAIMSYTGYNVEDAILVNKGALDRGLFRTTYYNMYEMKEESSDIPGSTANSKFMKVTKDNVKKLKHRGHNYDHLDENGVVKLNTRMTEDVVVIGKGTQEDSNDVYSDDSIVPKKGQLGYVDKVYISDNEEGFRIAKVRIRDERIPAIGDKMASRAGQKGTIGLVIPEEDMPYTAEGIKPDLIINPHAVPSRMTIGQLTECILGKLCAEKGLYGDCTPFLKEGPKEEVIGNMLVEHGYHSSGDEILYNGMTGEQLSGSVFMGPTYYMRLKHMVKDKINHRSTGPITMLTRQSVHGRANDGGLRIGEMERDGVIGHGASQFLKESFTVRGDDYQMAVCNQTGNIAVYNVQKKQFYSPMVDGMMKYSEPITELSRIKNISKYGKSFSIVKVPYTFKLLIQELQAMNIQMRIITEDNINQLTSMSYSNNIEKLTNKSDIVVHGKEAQKTIRNKINMETREKDAKKLKNRTLYGKNVSKTPEEEYVKELTGEQISPDYAPGSPADAPGGPVYDPNSQVYDPNSPPYSAILGRTMTEQEFKFRDMSPEYGANSPEYAPNSPAYAPNSPAYGGPLSPVYDPNSPPYSAILGRTMTEAEFNLQNKSKSSQGSSSFTIEPGTPNYNPATPELGETPNYDISESGESSYKPISSHQIMKNSILQQDSKKSSASDDDEDETEEPKSSSSGKKKIIISTP